MSPVVKNVQAPANRKKDLKPTTNV